LSRFSIAQLTAYGILGLPLAMAALPIYVHVPKFYSDLGMSLAAIGGILLAARLLDAMLDPLLGWWSDRARASRFGRLWFIGFGMPLLAVGMLGLFNPVADAAWLAYWLIASLALVYFGFSMATISYQAYGAELSADSHERTRVTAMREGLSVVGVLLAAALPEIFAQSAGMRAGFAQFAALFAPLTLACCVVMLLFSPRPPPFNLPPAHQGNALQAMVKPFHNRLFNYLLAAFLLNGIAAAIPATLVLFFVQDIIGRNDLAAQFLIAYFLAGAIGMPGWVWLARRIGKRGAWLAGMALSVLSFVWAFSLTNGDVASFTVICILSGLGLGADLSLPPSILADVIDDDEARGMPRNEGAYFGLWNLVTKLNLALAAGMALPLLAWFGYSPGTNNVSAGKYSLTALAAIYALLPSLLKIGAAIALSIMPSTPAVTNNLMPAAGKPI
jgi:glycoside/pentoside/hexuronide:cation symporter, GPH family